MKDERKVMPEDGPPLPPAADSLLAPRSDIVPGQVWWCDGIALQFDPYSKRRPVLILQVTDDGADVIPLSSRRRYGQETAVHHQGGISYMTGSIHPVPRTALQKPLGFWSEYPTWLEQQRTLSDIPPTLWEDLKNRLLSAQKRFRNWFSSIDMLV